MFNRAKHKRRIQNQQEFFLLELHMYQKQENYNHDQNFQKLGLKYVARGNNKKRLGVVQTVGTIKIYFVVL
jgi:hypothetical protein